MKSPDLPPDERDRLASLKRMGILDTPAEERFDRITRLARRVFGTDFALVSLVDQDRQWFKSAQGIDVTETSREVSFCAHAIQGEDLFVVPDASSDPRFSDNPLVSGDPEIRFYAGQPIRSPDGFLVGTLCVIDRDPRELSKEDAGSLKDLAALVEKEFRIDELSVTEIRLRSELAEAERRAAVDPLTRLWNRGFITNILAGEFERASRERLPLGVAVIDIDHFKLINDQHGHLAGDEVLRRVSGFILQGLRPYDSVGRYGGEEFLAVFNNCDPPEARRVAERIRAKVMERPVQVSDGKLNVTVSIGICSRVPDPKGSMKKIFEAADTALYRAKESGRNRVEICS